jgi:glycerophosphoryl diester phosphodiesterase
MASAHVLLAGYDGRVTEPEAKVPAGLMPLVSERWGKTFAWNGEGDMPATERARLRAIVAEMHGQGRMLRFWETPDSPRAWRELLEAGVDFIGTDSLHPLRQFLRDYAKTSRP